MARTGIRKGIGLGVPEMDRKALISDDKLYRYVLTRRWGYGAHATFVMLNPSTADGRTDDPTIRRCIGYARSWGLHGLVVLNLYAYRATDPRALSRVSDPIGPDNDEWIQRYLYTAARHDMPLVFAWGHHADEVRAMEVRAMDMSVERAMAFGLTSNRQPMHPLFLPMAARPRPIRELEARRPVPSRVR